MACPVRLPDWRCPARVFGLAVLLLAGATFGGPPARGGEAGASFQITLQLIPEAPGTCSANTDLGAPQVTCRPTVVGSAAGGADPRTRGPALYVRPETAIRLAGEMIEVGAENHYAWQESNSVALSETSTRRVVAGGHEYVEMTFSW